MMENSPHWFKSSYSCYASNCVEVSNARFPAVVVRDSVHPRGLRLAVPAGQWTDFVRLLRA